MTGFIPHLSVSQSVTRAVSAVATIGHTSGIRHGCCVGGCKTYLAGCPKQQEGHIRVVNLDIHSTKAPWKAAMFVFVFRAPPGRPVVFARLLWSRVSRVSCLVSSVECQQHA